MIIEGQQMTYGELGNNFFEKLQLKKKKSQTQ